MDSSPETVDTTAFTNNSEWTSQSSFPNSTGSEDLTSVMETNATSDIPLTENLSTRNSTETTVGETTSESHDGNDTTSITDQSETTSTVVSPVTTTPISQDSSSDDVNTEEPSSSPNGNVTSSDVHTTESDMTPKSSSAVSITDFPSTQTIAETSSESNNDGSPCDGLNPCQNGGTCSKPASGSIHCTCQEGFIGKLCQIREYCNDGICSADSVCIYSEDLTSRFCECFSGKHWDSEGKLCRGSSPPCFPNPCENGASCLANSTENYKCECREGYEGPTCGILNTCGKIVDGKVCGGGVCETNVADMTKRCTCREGEYYDSITHLCQVNAAPCKPNPCGDHGTCQTVDNDHYNCSCNSLYYGNQCEYDDYCLEDKPGDGCANGACILLESKGFRQCVCNEGFAIDSETGKCRGIDKPCFPSPCKNGGICNGNSSSYNCECAEGFAGKDCENRDRCKLDGGNNFCENAHCLMDYGRSTFYCQCGDNEYFDYGKRECSKLDLCPLMKCAENDECRDNKCTCKTGYTFNQTTSECKAEFCKVFDCPAKHMFCTENRKDPENYLCYCPEGQAFNGTHCNDAACLFPSLNGCKQICISNSGSHTCSCVKPFTLNADGISCDLKEGDGCVNKKCTIGACVKDSTGKEMCMCPPGYVEQGGHCIDLCTAKALPPGTCPQDQCVSDKELGFRCTCSGKYTQSSDKVTCSPKRMCSAGADGFKACKEKNAVCFDEWSNEFGYFCLCKPGFYKTEDGTCKNICDIEENRMKCYAKGAICALDENSRFTCVCPPSFTTDKNGICKKIAEHSFLLTLPIYAEAYVEVSSGNIARSSFTENTDISFFLLRKALQQSMEFLFGSLKHLNILKCKKIEDFLNCKLEMQLDYVDVFSSYNRLLMSSSFFNNDSIANDVLLVPPSLQMRKSRVPSRVSISETDPCDSDIKDELCDDNTICKNADGDFTCTCKPGYRSRRRNYPTDNVNTFIDNCEDIDECKEGNPCPSSAKCSNTIGSYECLCLPGYIRNNQSSDHTCSELCKPNPCVHGQCEKSGDHSFECSCDAGYSGALCNFEDKNYKGAKMDAVIVGVVLGGVLLITVILFASTVSRLRRKKFIDDPTQILYSTEMTEQRPVVLSAANPTFERD